MQVKIDEKTDIEILMSTEVNKEDYQAAYQKELKDIQAKVHLKGFRKGKTPMGYIQKVYGRKTRFEMVTQKAYEAFMEKFKEEKLNMMLEPILDGDNIAAFQSDLKVDHVSFNFVTAFVPSIELKGLSKEDSYVYYNPIVSDDEINAVLENQQKRLGKQDSVDGEIQAGDLLVIDAKEKDGDYQTEFTVAVDNIGDEKLQKSMLKKKKGGAFTFDIYTIEKDRDEAFIDQYILEWDESKGPKPSSTFKGKIKDVKRVVPSARDEDFYKSFGPEVTDEAGAIEVIKEAHKNQLKGATDRLFMDEVFERLEKDNDLPVPTHYIKQSYKQNPPENMDEQGFEKQFKFEFQNQLRMRLLLDKYKIQVTESEVRMEFEHQIAANFGNQFDAEMMNNFVNYYMQDKEQTSRVRNQIMDQKLIEAIKASVTLNEEDISVDNLNKKIDELNTKVTQEAVGEK